MSGGPVPNERSNPIIWTICMVVFIVGVSWWFSRMFKTGVSHALEHPVEVSAGPSGPAEPDHAAILGALQYGSDEYLKLGKQVYAANCTTCHGADGGVPKIAGARNFRNEPLVNGEDPYGIYLTLVNGYSGEKGNMPAQGQLDAEEKYAVIHYIREVFIKPNHPQADKYAAPITDDYIANGEWPAPSSGDGAAAGYHGDEYVMTAPIFGAMAQLADDDALALDLLTQAASTIEDQHIASAIRLIAANPANQAYAESLIGAATSANLDGLAVLLTDPGHNAYQPQLALLSRPSLAMLAKALREQATAADSAGDS